MGLLTTRRHRRHRTKSRAGTVSALVFATCTVLATSCSGGGTPGAGSGADGPPVRGGRLIYGLGADANGFNPVTDSFSTQTYAMAGTIIETLTAIDATGRWRPLLAESVEPNEDSTRWTIKLRQGVSFSTGEPVNAEVVKANLAAQKASPLTAAVLAPVSVITAVDARTVQVDLAGPWVSFPTTLSTQIGMIVPPASLTAPDRASRRPVGTGPFVFQSYTPDNRFIVKRNPEYWRDGLPYLDGVEFRILPDFQTRAQTLESGGLTAMATQRDTDIVKFGKLAEQGAYELYRTSGMAVPELAFMLNTAAGPTKDLRVRRAMAHATDRDAFIETLRSDLTKPADGPWSPDSPWYVPGGYPAFDPAEAKSLIDEYERENGPVRIELLSVPDQSSMQNAELVQDMWGKAGMEVSVRQADQSTLIERALTGNYGAIVWEQFTRPDPDGEYSFLHSRFVQPVGSISINMSRIKDEQLSAALDAGRASSDEATREKAYATVQKRLRATLPFIWVDHLSTSAVITKSNVHGLARYELPDGSTAEPLTGSATHPFGQIWLGG
ncbi:ABC transporter substrate-binding protein [Actinomadura algeriensis]|uniref:ABC-type transport system substrate-binding protein n=1 Tax=Actinomadura algeriensis TaxID=1679523 RepID=A0ABR9K4U0_9ACTN|nr:ABC transporter substrate-binding protein [Actinomadura algeriensis]MBE1537822.1 ABC-type transport system substrate-binding protein [Actinomadura algeriensis]